MDNPNKSAVLCNLVSLINILYKRLPQSNDDFITGCFLYHFDFVDAILNVSSVIFDAHY